MLVDGKSSLHISLYTRLLSPQPSDCCTLDYLHHPSVWLPMTSTVAYSSTDATWPFSVSIHSGGISASASYNLHSVDTESRKFISHTMWGTDAASCFIIWIVWISSHGRLQTLNAEQKRVPQRQSFLEIFAGTFQELNHILMKQCQSRVLICLQFIEKKLTFNCFSQHLCGRDATPWDHGGPVYLTESGYQLSYSNVYLCFALNCQNIGFIGHLVKI